MFSKVFALFILTSFIMSILIFDVVLAEEDGLISRSIYSIAVDEDYVWIGSRIGLLRYDKKNDKFTNFINKDGLKGDSVRSVAVDENYVWLGTLKRGLSRYDKRSGEFINFTTKDGLAFNEINSIAVDGDYVWIGTDGGGLSRYDKRNGKFTNFTTEDGLFSNSVMSIAVDEDYVWIGAQAIFDEETKAFVGEISRYNKRTSEFINFTIENSLIFKGVNSIAMDRDYVLFGTSGGLSILKRGRGFVDFTAKDELTSSYINSIAVDEDYVWLGNHCGLLRYDKRTEQITDLTDDTFIYKSVYSIVVDRDYVWIGTWGNGIFRYDRKTGKYTNFTTDKELIAFDSFDDQSSGTRPYGWDLAGGARADWYISNEYFCSPPNSLKVKVVSASSENAGIVGRRFSSLYYADLIFEFSALVTENNKSHTIVYDLGGKIKFMILFNNQGKICYLDARGLNVISTYSPKTWYDFKVIYYPEDDYYQKDDRYDIYLNGVLKGSNISPPDYFRSFLNYFGVSFDVADYLGGTIYLDDIRIYEK